MVWRERMSTTWTNSWISNANREEYVLEDASYDCDAPNVDGFFDIELKKMGVF